MATDREVAALVNCNLIELEGPAIELPETATHLAPSFIPTGHVYFVQAVRAPKRIKIGYSSHVQIRFEALQSGCPYPLRFLGAIRGTRVTEAALHEALAEYRAHGEWFENRRPLRAALGRLLLKEKP